MTRILLLPLFITAVFSFSGKALWAVSSVPLSAEVSGVKLNAASDTGLTYIDDDLFVPVIVEMGLISKSVELSIQAPFRFRIMDNAPEDTGVLRQQDWDDHSDWARILRTLRINKKLSDGNIVFHAGELNGVHQGFDEVVSEYFNSADMDHYHGGVDASMSFRGNGLAVLLDDVVSPSIFAGRIFLAPVAWFTSHRMARRFQVGAHLFADKGVKSRTLRIQDTSLVAAGINLSFVAVETALASLTPYISFGAMDGDAGFHGGIVTDTAFSRKRNQGLRFQSEFRYAGEDYYPGVLNPFYNYNRRFFTRDPVTGELNTFKDHLANTNMNVKPAAGIMVDVEMHINHILQLGIRYDYQSKNRPHWLLFRFEFTPTENLSFSGFYGGQDIQGGLDIFSLDALLGLAYHQRVTGPLRLYSEFCRRFRRTADNSAFFANESTLGVGLVLVR
ncbi:MAG: hypothetical protein JXX14_24375 [Deltaproteobacteria bacterium]|nr:hypothetical protein [Deltaproteobacteria bacterium]